MKRCNRKFFLPIAAGVSLILTTFVYSATKASADEIGKKGAQVYCFMRNNGNGHEASWNAAYEVIKRQKSNIFKTSPKHGAVMIIETVINKPEDYGNCSNYLGDLLTPPNNGINNNESSEDSELIEGQDITDNQEPAIEEEETPSASKKGDKKDDRYAY